MRVRSSVIRSVLVCVLAVGHSAAAPPPAGHEEKPVKPPAQPVDRANQPRSPRAIVTRGTYRSIQVNVDGGQNNIVGDAANEPSIAIDPTNPNNLVIAWRQFDTIASDFRQAGVAYSHDGGETWHFNGVLQPGHFRSDPVLSADSLGNFYYYSLDTATSGQFFVSADKGVSWTGPIPSPPGDKNWQTVDATGGPGDGHIYALWNSQFTCCGGGTDFTRSSDGTVSFDGPYALPQHPKWGTDAVGPDGELYIVGTTLSQSGHLILRSDNAEDALATPTFPLARSISLGGTTVAGGPPNPGGLLGQVWVAVDRSGGASRGNVYVLASVDPPGSDPLDVRFIRSTDHGQTWSASQRVNDDPTTNGAYQWFGTMAVAPDGRIDVVWNDTRNGGASFSELYYAYSTDAGASFSPGVPVSPGYDSTIGHPVQDKIGDYYHMVSDVAAANLAWAATFNGEEDVYFLRLGDCNANGQHDSVDLAFGTSADANANGIPDECEPDCNGNAVPDDLDITLNQSADCDGNAVPDECDLAAGNGADCNGDGVLDACSVTFDLETNQGFLVGAANDTASNGIWVRVDPIGTAAQPEDDHTPAPGTMCYVTGATSDVDTGRTTLFTPAMDLSGIPDPRIGYWRWYNNSTSGDPGLDRLLIDVSADGGQSWFNVETIGPTGAGTGGGWIYHSFRVADRVTPTNQVQLRFIASDYLTSTVVEAAIDDVVILDCSACAVSAPEEVGNLRLGRAGTTAQLSWSPEPFAASYRLYRGGRADATDLACLQSAIAGTSATDDGTLPAPGEFFTYVASAANCAGESGLGPGRVAFDACP